MSAERYQKMMEELNFWLKLSNEEKRKGDDAFKRGDAKEVHECLVRHRVISERYRRAVKEHELG